jgi:lipopolysaccharide/colanic/teichoic acid biosynthesis glycosyltransferase
MPKEFIKINSYHRSLSKQLLDFGFLIVGLVVMAPLFLLITFVIYVTMGIPVYFTQKRIGKDGKVFKIIKFRTMVIGAEKMQKSLFNQNQADGPAFKIYDDPRFTRFGKALSRTGLDELPQMINVFKGEMSIVGPRPLPVGESKKLSKLQKIRELVKPGITSNWVVEGSHQLSFKKWMQLDREYVKSATFFTDLSIAWRTLALVAGFILKYMFF